MILEIGAAAHDDADPRARHSFVDEVVSGLRRGGDECGREIYATNASRDHFVLSTTTAPPFITHFTLLSTTLMSASGSPSTATMSAK